LGAGIAAVLELYAARGASNPDPVARTAGKPAYVRNQACQTCHREIYESYARTPMARTSGLARPNLIEGAFRHERSGVQYRVFADGDKAYLAYERPGDPAMRGRQELEYSVGSNTRGRTFLFEIEGLLYQSPINYYAQKRVWDMSPGYQSLTEMELNHAVPPSCLFCHASGVQTPEPGAPNRYAGAPFLQDGVGCERCHGPGGDHVLGKGDLVDPSKLAGARRDAVCVQCHLEGQATVRRVGRTLEAYRPGDLLSDYVTTFVYEETDRDALGAVSQVEALARSRCKRRSGDRLTCITCHDPHTTPPPERRVAYYRDKCLMCHEPSFAQRHQGGNPDCIACHMPRHESADIGHTQVTDHRIPRRPSAGSAASAPAPDRRLVPFGPSHGEPRDLGLAYAEVALRGNAFAGQEAVRLLEQALDRNPRDPEVLTHLGFLYDQIDKDRRAAVLYERALEVDPEAAVAVSNLAVIYASRGDLEKALPLWKRSFAEDPGRSAVGMDLALGLCKSGDAPGARDTLVEVLRHNPDLGRARAMLREVDSAPGDCGSAVPLHR
jgi:Tfp pilus assembly protein PilF